MGKLLWFQFLAETSFRNLLRSPRRTLISLLVIASATAALLIFQAFVNGVKKTFRHNVITSVYGHYQIYPKGFRNHLDDAPVSLDQAQTEDLRNEINHSVGQLQFFSRRVPFYGLINFNDHSVGGVGFGIDAEEELKFLTLTKVHDGKHLAESEQDSIFIGYRLADRLKVKPGDMVTVLVTSKTGSLNALDLQVVGTFKTGITELDQGTYQVHLNTAHTLLRTSGTPLVLLGFQQENELPFEQPLRHLIAEKYPDYEVAHWKELADFFDNTMGWIEKQVMVFRWIILLIVSLSIVTVFFMGLFERTGEFGTLRAIGTHQQSLALMIFFESFVQSVLGSIIGLLATLFIINAILSGGIYMPPPPLMSVPFHVQFEFPWSNAPAIIALCILVSGGAGIFPALKISRMGIVEALGRNV